MQESKLLLQSMAAVVPASQAASVPARELHEIHLILSALGRRMARQRTRDILRAIMVRLSVMRGNLALSA